jgi:hypothetical protein
MSSHWIRTDGGVTIKPRGAEVSRLCFERGGILISLAFDDGTTYGLRLESIFSVLVDGEEAVDVSPSNVEARELEVLLALLGQVVGEINATPEAELHLVLSEARLTATPDPNFEAWSITSGSSTFQLVAEPGGSLAIWD